MSTRLVQADSESDPVSRREFWEVLCIEDPFGRSSAEEFSTEDKAREVAGFRMKSHKEVYLDRVVRTVVSREQIK